MGGKKTCVNCLWGEFLLLVFVLQSKYEIHAESIATTATSAIKCTEDIRLNNCILPNCRCSGHDIPGNLTRSQVPQLVFLTFDDAVNDQNFDLYNEMFLFQKRTNPNGHPITLTYFVSHEYTDYSMVHNLWRHGHEIALHSITHSEPVDYWSSQEESMWHQELVDQRKQMSAFANIPASDMKGMRAPFLQGGGDAMYKVLHSFDFTWESSRLSNADQPYWPYTNDFASTQACDILPCPKNRHPGFWTVPMIRFTGANGESCAMVDVCYPVPTTAKDTYQLLYKNFQRHYNGNRAPYGIFAHSAWLVRTPEAAERRQGYIKFLDYLATLTDTYIVGISRALEWIKSPRGIDDLKDFTPFHVELKSNKCKNTRSCSYTPFEDNTDRWFHSCASECPKSYPWLGNPFGH